MKRLPIGKAVYRDLIEGNFVYVDKTPFLVELADSGIATFLSRPRRFGKSLTVNTFREMFRGSRELFKDTFAYDNWDFAKTSPVIRLDMSVCSAADAKGVNHKIISILKSNCIEYSMNPQENTFSDGLFRELIQTLSGRQGKVAILIDEYDAPILDALGKPNLQEIKELLRGFYKVIKEQEENIRFVFITGISKFSRVGVFSALNNLRDITLDDRYAAIAGYTKEEIDTFFSPFLKEAQKANGLSRKEFDEKLMRYYNGYSWDGATFMYNPFSILCFLDRKAFAPYWMETGSPSFMIHYARTHNLTFDDVDGTWVDKSFMSTHDIDETSPVSFLTQAGYLTIKKAADNEFELGFPNFEVKHTFTHLLLTSAVGVNNDDYMGVRRALRSAFESDDTAAFIEQIKIIFSSVPAVYFQGNQNEYFYASVLYMFLTAAGFNVTAEKYSNKGRMDITLFWKKERVYVLELKADSAQHALEQIRAKNYAGQFANSNVILAGLKIDFEQRNVVEWVVG